MYNSALSSDNMKSGDQLEYSIFSCYKAANQVLQRQMVEIDVIEKFSAELLEISNQNLTSIFLMSENVQLLVIGMIQNMPESCQIKSFELFNEHFITLWTMEVIEPKILIKLVYVFHRMSPFPAFLTNLLFRRSEEVSKGNTKIFSYF